MDAPVIQPEEQKSVKPLFIAVAILVLAAVAYFAFRYYQSRQTAKPQPPSMEDILKSLTAPAGTNPKIPEKVIKSISAPTVKQTQSPSPSPDLLKSLTAPSR